jgi:predicted RNase H-like HicB family nuclease
LFTVAAPILQALIVGLRTKSVYNLTMTRRVLLYPGEDGFIVAEVPSLPGCISQGRTRDEALENVREAISLHEEVLRERGEPLPEDRVELVEVAA